MIDMIMEIVLKVILLLILFMVTGRHIHFIAKISSLTDEQKHKVCGKRLRLPFEEYVLTVTENGERVMYKRTYVLLVLTYVVLTISLILMAVSLFVWGKILYLAWLIIEAAYSLVLAMIMDAEYKNWRKRMRNNGIVEWTWTSRWWTE